jgi:anti-sigma factor RsiW
MPQPHIDEELLDQYALGSLGRELLPAVEEHLLVCPDCQTRLAAADEFLGLFRVAATLPDARRRTFPSRLFSARVLTWAGAAAMVVTVFFLMSGAFRQSPVAPAMVFMHGLRGPEAAAAIPAGKPARLVFDLTPTGTAQDYEVRIVNLLGTQVLAAPVELSDGHLSILIRKPKFGSYWVRVYRKANRELIAEFGLRAE